MKAVKAVKAGRGATLESRLSRAAAAALLASLLLSACTGTGDGVGLPSGSSTNTASRSTSATGGSRAAQEPQVLRKIDGLQLPWSTVFLPDGTAIISERDSTYPDFSIERLS